MAAKPTSLCFLQDAHILREAQLQLADAEKDEGFPYVVTRVPKTLHQKLEPVQLKARVKKPPTMKICKLYKKP